MQSPPRIFRSRILSILFINFLLLGLGIFIVEMLFGNWWGTNSIMRLNIPQKADLACEFPAKDGTCHYKRDEYGLRGPFEDIAAIDLLTVGGSTTDQREISEGETWQDWIAQLFHKNGKKVEIANAGVSGHSVYANSRSFKLWFRHIPGLKPKYVMAYVGINDYCLDPKFYVDLLTDEPTWKTLFKKRSALYYLYQTLRGIYLSFRNPYYHPDNGDVSKAGVTDTPLVENHAAWMQRRLPAYEKRLLRLVQRIREFNAIPILVTQKMHSYWIEEGKILGNNEPYLCRTSQVNGVDDYHMLNLINKITLKVCKDQNLICFDLASELDLKKEDYFDDMHNSPQGSAKIGNYLYEKLKPYF